MWEGEANANSYTIREETDPEKLIPRGTRLTLYLKVCKFAFCSIANIPNDVDNLFLTIVSYAQRDDKGFAHPERIQNLVKNYSQFVSFPIYTWQEKGFTKEVRD